MNAFLQYFKKILKPCYIPEEDPRFYQKLKSSAEQTELDSQVVTDNISDSNKDSSNEENVKRLSLPDIPKTRLQDDLLDYRSYAEAIGTLIANPGTETPLTIGIFGAWGSGKTTLMNMINQVLKRIETDSTKNNTHTNPSTEKFVTIFFNAWKYSADDSLQRSIILRVLDRLSEESSKTTDKEEKLKQEITRLEQRLYRDVEWEDQGKMTVDWPQFIKGSVGGAIKLSFSYAPGLNFLSEAVKSAQGSLGKGVIADDFLGAFQKSVVKHKQTQLKYIEEFQNQFKDLISDYFSQKIIIVFVDDLDRCLPEKAIEVLESIKLFMDVKNCIFILGLDQKIVSRGFQVRYKGIVTNSEQLAIEGIRYLEKIIQLPFLLPPLEAENMRRYVQSLNADWPSTDPKDGCATIFAEGLPPNPRQVKRTINIFLLLWKLTQIRCDQSAVITSTSKTHESINCITALRLAKVVVLQTAYPTLFEQLKINPSLLKQLEAYCKAADSSQTSPEKAKMSTDQTEQRTSEILDTEELQTVQLALPIQQDNDLEARDVETEVSESQIDFDVSIINSLLEQTTEPGKLQRLFATFLEYEKACFAELSSKQLAAFFSLTGQVPIEISLVTDELLQPSVSTSPTKVLNNLPRSSTNFIGRESTLFALHERLKKADKSALVSIVGMDGVGKTALAIQYASNFKLEYQRGICWLHARDSDISNQIVDFSKTFLGLKLPEELDSDSKVQYCWTQWPVSENYPALIIYDDVSDYNEIKTCLPPSNELFKVLITTRVRDLASSVSDVVIHTLSPVSSLELLVSLIGKDRVESELDTAKALCEWSGYLPLAIQVVGANLKLKPDLSLEVMLERLKTQSLGLQNNPGTTQYSISKIFDLTWRELEAEAQTLACWLSLFALAPIPWSLALTPLLQEGMKENDIENIRDEFLLRISLLQRVSPEIYQLHPLIRKFLLAKVSSREDFDNLKQLYCKNKVSISQQVPQTLTQEDILKLAPLIPHLKTAVTSWQDSIEDQDLTWPFIALARFYDAQSAEQQAEDWLQQCLHATQRRFGDMHPDVATSLNNLAYIYQSRGRYDEASTLYRQALEMRQNLLGNEHPDIAASLNNLASLYKLQGKYEEALSLYKEALAMLRQIRGNDHPDVATSLNNLADLYLSLGQYEEAEQLYQDALIMRKSVFGAQHPDVASLFNSLAELNRLQGRYSEAEPLYNKALEILRQLLGAQHPAVATNINNLAILYDSQGHYEKAQELYQQSLEIFKQNYGEEHPAIANSLNNLANLYANQKLYEKAEVLYEQALNLNQKSLGKENPTVAQNLNNLANLYYAQGLYLKAEPLYQEALSIKKQILGEEHPDVATSLNNLATVYAAEKEFEKAETLYLKTIGLRKRLLGEQHPYVAISLNNLATLYTKQERYSEAKQLYEEALDIANNSLGAEHPTTVGIQTQLKNL